MFARVTLGYAAVLALSACATPYPYGSLYTGVSMPVAASEAEGGTKVGRACSMSILSLVATGDASIETAKAKGGIRSVTSVDIEVENILGVVGQYCTVVRGN